MKIKEYYRRNLPHYQPLEGIFNICFRLAESLPVEKWKQLKDIQELRIKEIKAKENNLTSTTLKIALKTEEDLYFGKFDQLLDNYYSSPTFLRISKVAKIVSEAILYGHNTKRYEVICFCIMPNHVHLILHKAVDQLFNILHSIKRYSAREANKHLNRTGSPFWQKESYDNLIRDDADLAYKINYILNNPVKAKLVNDWKDWELNYINDEYREFIS